MASCGIAKWLLLLSTTEIVSPFKSGVSSGSVGGTYKFAQKLYGQGNVFPALKTFEAAFRNHLYREDVELTCQLKCIKKENDFEEDREEIEARAFESLFTKTLCLENCFKENNASEMNRASGNSKTELDNRFVYHYLHFLYNEIGEGKEAMNLVWTYLQKFPKNKDMLSNYFLYLELYPELSRAKATFLDYDEGTLDKTVKKIVKLYNDQDYASLPPLIDAAIIEYFQLQKTCKLRCFLTPEKSDHNFGQSTFISLLEQEINNLDCKRSCLKIKSPYGIFSDFLVKFFVQNKNQTTFDPLIPIETFLHYLHFSYFQSGNHTAAAEIAATRLLLPLDTFHEGGESREDINNDLQAFQILNPDVKIQPRSDITAHLAELDELESFLFSSLSL